MRADANSGSSSRACRVSCAETAHWLRLLAESASVKSCKARNEGVVTFSSCRLERSMRSIVSPSVSRTQLESLRTAGQIWSWPEAVSVSEARVRFCTGSITSALTRYVEPTFSVRPVTRARMPPSRKHTSRAWTAVRTVSDGCFIRRKASSTRSRGATLDELRVAQFPLQRGPQRSLEKGLARSILETFEHHPIAFLEVKRRARAMAP